MINSCVKYHNCMSKGNGVCVETVQSFKSEFELDPKTNRGAPWIMINSCVKYHHCMSKGKGVIVRNQFFYRQTDRQTDGRMVKPVYPHNFVVGGITTGRQYYPACLFLFLK